MEFNNLEYIFGMEISLEALNKITAHYHLRSREIGKLTIIYLVVRIHSKQYKYSTGLKVYPEHWDYKRLRALVCSHFSEIINRHSVMINSELMRAWRQYEDWKLEIANNPSSFKVLTLKNKNIMRQIKKGNAILELMRLVDAAEMTSSSKVKYQSEI